MKQILFQDDLGTVYEDGYYMIHEWDSSNAPSEWMMNEHGRLCYKHSGHIHFNMCHNGDPLLKAGWDKRIMACLVEREILSD
jgi:hypothetical protein